MSGTSFWYRPGQFPPRRAARSGGPPASNSTAKTDSPGWTLSPAEGGHPELPHAGDCPVNGPCCQCRTLPNRYDSAHAEQAQAGAATARVSMWRFRDGNDGGSGCALGASTSTAGIDLLHVAQSPDAD